MSMTLRKTPGSGVDNINENLGGFQQFDASILSYANRVGKTDVTREDLRTLMANEILPEQLHQIVIEFFKKHKDKIIATYKTSAYPELVYYVIPKNRDEFSDIVADFQMDYDCNYDGHEGIPILFNFFPKELQFELDKALRQINLSEITS